MKAIVELKYFDKLLEFDDIHDETDYIKDLIDDNLHELEMVCVTEYHGDLDHPSEPEEGDDSYNIVLCLIVDLKEQYVANFRNHKEEILSHIQSALGIIPLDIHQEWRVGNDHYLLLSLEQENLERFQDL